MCPSSFVSAVLRPSLCSYLLSAGERVASKTQGRSPQHSITPRKQTTHCGARTPPSTTACTLRVSEASGRQSSPRRHFSRRVRTTSSLYRRISLSAPPSSLPSRSKFSFTSVVTSSSSPTLPSHLLLHSRLTISSLHSSLYLYSVYTITIY